MRFHSWKWVRFHSFDWNTMQPMREILRIWVNIHSWKPKTRNGFRFSDPVNCHQNFIKSSGKLDIDPIDIFCVRTKFYAFGFNRNHVFRNVSHVWSPWGRVLSQKSEKNWRGSQKMGHKLWLCPKFLCPPVWPGERDLLFDPLPRSHGWT